MITEKLRAVRTSAKRVNRDRNSCPRDSMTSDFVKRNVSKAWVSFGCFPEKWNQENRICRNDKPCQDFVSVGGYCGDRWKYSLYHDSQDHSSRRVHFDSQEWKCNKMGQILKWEHQKGGTNCYECKEGPGTHCLPLFLLLGQALLILMTRGEMNSTALDFVSLNLNISTANSGSGVHIWCPENWKPSKTDPTCCEASHVLSESAVFDSWRQFSSSISHFSFYGTSQFIAFFPCKKHVESYSRKTGFVDAKWTFVSRDLKPWIQYLSFTIHHLAKYWDEMLPPDEVWLPLSRLWQWNTLVLRRSKAFSMKLHYLYREVTSFFRGFLTDRFCYWIVSFPECCGVRNSKTEWIPGFWTRGRPRILREVVSSDRGTKTSQVGAPDVQMATAVPYRAAWDTIHSL